MFISAARTNFPFTISYTGESLNRRSKFAQSIYRWDLELTLVAVHGGILNELGFIVSRAITCALRSWNIKSSLPRYYCKSMLLE